MHNTARVSLDVNLKYLCPYRQQKINIGLEFLRHNHIEKKYLLQRFIITGYSGTIFGMEREVNANFFQSQRHFLISVFSAGYQNSSSMSITEQKY